MTVKHLYTESLYNSLEIRVNLYGRPHNSANMIEFEL